MFLASITSKMNEQIRNIAKSLDATHCLSIRSSHNGKVRRTSEKQPHVKTAKGKLPPRHQRIWCSTRAMFVAVDILQTVFKVSYFPLLSNKIPLQSNEIPVQSNKIIPPESNKIPRALLTIHVNFRLSILTAVLPISSYD